jgi:hypothetical protein
MSFDTSREEGVIQGFRRRRVIRVVVAYLAVCLGGVSAGSLLFDLLAAPDWAFRALLGASALGFPITVVLAWTYDVTPEGIVRTPEQPPAESPGDPAPAWLWRVATAAGVLLAILVWILRKSLG